jgi:hypothetical protein
MAAALFLAAGHALAWDRISGDWCSKKDGCGKWHSIYKVQVEIIKPEQRKKLEKELESVRTVWPEILRLEAELKKMGLFDSQKELFDPQKELFFSQREYLRSRIDEHPTEIAIKIRYRDIKLKRQSDLLQIISGKIEPDVKWTIENGTVDERDGADVRVYQIMARMGKGGGGRTAGGAEPEIEGTITGKFKIKPGVFWEGTAPFKGTTAAGIVRQSVEAKKEGPIQDTIEIEATIDGGKHAVKGVLKGTVKQRAEGWRISGVYTPPPGDRCSYYAGGLPRAASELPWAKGAWLTSESRNLRDFEMSEMRKLSLRDLARKKLEAVPRGGLRTQEQKEELEIRLQSRWIRGLEPTTVASARKVPARAPDEQPLGKFQRRIGGTINAKKDTITITLPPLPVLNYRCEVVEISSEKELILVRQGSIQPIEPSGSEGDRPEGGRGGAADRGRP